MLNFLRKLRRREIKGGQYVKYALGEILLVVIGILIALQLNAWNDQRKERVKEQIVLRGLVKDFTANDSIISQGLSDHQLHLQECVDFLKYLGPNADELGITTMATENPANYVIIDIVEGGLSALLNSERLEIIRNEELKALLTAYPSSLADYREHEGVSRDLVVNKIRPRAEKYLALVAVDPTLIPITEVHPSNYRDYVRDRMTQNEVVNRIWIIRNWVIPHLTTLQTHNSNILNLLNQEIKD